VCPVLFKTSLTAQVKGAQELLLKMGNSSSSTTRTVSVENDLLRRAATFNSSCGCDCESIALRVFKREFARQAMAGPQLPPSNDHLEAALAQLRRNTPPKDEHTPKELKKLQQCLRESESDRLRCQKEINDFVAFVSKPSSVD
jgi:hypothetical protein